MSETGKQHVKIILGPTSAPVLENVTTPESMKIWILLKHRGQVSPFGHEPVYYDDKTLAAFSDLVPDASANAIINDCMNDITCQYLAERERSSLFEGPFSGAIKISQYVCYVNKIFKNTRPNLVVFHAFPHELFTYIFLKTSVHYNVQRLLVHNSIFPWRMCISYITDTLELKRIQVSSGPPEGDANIVANYLENLKKSYEDAIPIYDKIMEKRAGGYFIDLKYELKNITRKNPVKTLLRLYLKRKAYRELENAITKMPEGPYVVFFLHYQPEESSLPRGGLFSQQYLAILKLRSMLPEDVNLLIKEHPSMYRYEYTLAITVRPASFYRNINQLYRTHIIPQDTDTFRLIDESMAVATLTGTVGIEALARGKQVICFGEAYFKAFSGVTFYKNMNSDNLCFAGEMKHDPALIERDLAEEAKCAIGKDPHDYPSSLKYQREAIIDAYQYVFSNYEKLLCGPGVTR